MNDTRDLNHQSLKGLCNDFLNYIFIGLQWPASYCYQTKAGCCLPTTGKPAIDFFITGLQTYNSTTGKAVTKCTKSNFNITEVILLSISLKWHIKFLSGFSFSWSNLHLWSVYMIVWSEIWSFFFFVSSFWVCVAWKWNYSPAFGSDGWVECLLEQHQMPKQQWAQLLEEFMEDIRSVFGSEPTWLLQDSSWAQDRAQFALYIYKQWWDLLLKRDENGDMELLGTREVWTYGNGGASNVGRKGKVLASD